MGSSNSTSVSVKHNRTTSRSTFLQCLFTQYLHEVVITILRLQPFLQMYVQDDTLHHLYETPTQLYTYDPLYLPLYEDPYTGIHL